MRNKEQMKAKKLIVWREWYENFLHFIGIELCSILILCVILAIFEYVKSAIIIIVVGLILVTGIIVLVVNVLRDIKIE